MWRSPGPVRPAAFAAPRQGEGSSRRAGARAGRPAGHVTPSRLAARAPAGLFVGTEEHGGDENGPAQAFSLPAY